MKQMRRAVCVVIPESMEDAIRSSRLQGGAGLTIAGWENPVGRHGLLVRLEGDLPAKYAPEVGKLIEVVPHVIAKQPNGLLRLMPAFLAPKREPSKPAAMKPKPEAQPCEASSQK